MEIYTPFKERKFMQKSLFDEDNNIFTPSGVIRVSNNLIRGRGKINKKAITRGGKKVYVSETTVNDKRIEDTCIEIFQAEEITSKLRIDHKKLEKEALDYLLPLFEEYDLVEKEENSKKLNEQIRDYKEIALDSYVKNEVSKYLPTVLKFPIKEFIQRTGIARIQSRFNEALQTVNQSSSKVGYSWMEQTIIFEEKDGVKSVKQKNELMSGSIIPLFGLEFNDKIKEVLSPQEIKSLTMEKFIEMDLNNKQQYVDYIKMELNPKTLVNIVGIGLFGGIYGKGYAKSLRKNRNSFKKSITFLFDLLVRSIINLRADSNLRKFTFEELKDHLHASSYNSWEAFRKSVLVPVIEDFNNNTEMTCEYKLIPNNANWTHIQLFPEFKTTSMGFEASKYGYDYLAYFISVQHKYFQPNKLTDNLESFVVYIQGELYNASEDTELYGRTISEWKVLGVKVYQAEKELLNLIDENKELLKLNNLIYDEKRMCLVRENLKEEVEVEVDTILNDTGEVKTTKKSKTSYIVTKDYKVIDPISSFRYLNDLSCSGEATSINIFDFIPFQFATMDSSWVDINSIEKYSEYLEQIKIAAYKKKADWFRFDKQEKREVFLHYLHGRRFKEFESRFIELMEKLS